MKQTKSPQGLGKTGSVFWKKVMAEYVLEESHDQERLKMACKCLDENARCEAIVKKRGYSFETDMAA